MKDIGIYSPTAGAVPTFFPTPLPDESLYGLFCRYHQVSGNARASETRKQLVGERHQWPDDFVVRELMKRASAITGVTVDYLIDHHTQIPACLWLDHGYPIDGQDYLESRDLIHELFPGSLVPRRGRMPYWRDHPKICMSCYDNDIETVGYPYWHLFHQPQFVTACAEHSTRLLFGCPQCGTPFPCKYFELPVPECRFCDDLTITSGYVKHFRVSAIEQVVAQVTRHIIDAHRRPRCGWNCSIGCRRLVAHLGVPPADFLDESSECSRYATAVEEDLKLTKESWGIWSTELSSYLPTRRFEGFKVSQMRFTSIIGDILLGDVNCRHYFAEHSLWLLAYAVPRGVDAREAIGIYMGDDYLQ